MEIEKFPIESLEEDQPVLEMRNQRECMMRRRGQRYGEVRVPNFGWQKSKISCQLRSSDRPPDIDTTNCNAFALSLNFLFILLSFLFYSVLLFAFLQKKKKSLSPYSLLLLILLHVSTILFTYELIYPYYIQQRCSYILLLSSSSVFIIGHMPIYEKFCSLPGCQTVSPSIS